MRYAEFRSGFIWTSLTTAIVGGFAFGAYLAVVIGYGFPVGQGFYALIQTHGHLQLIGWVGVFIMGISLHFIPRLASFPLPHPERMNRILWLMVPGLLLRAVGGAVLVSFEGSPIFVPLSWLVVVSGALEGSAIVLYVLLLIETMRGSDKARRLPALSAVKPYFVMMAVGWVLYACLNLFLVLHMALSGTSTVDTAWNEFAITIFMSLVLLPVAFALSVRLFPLYLALPAPDWPVYGVGCVYLLAVCLQVIPTAPSLAGLAPDVTRRVVALGMLMKGGVILWFVWQLDLLTRRRPLGRHARFLDTGPDRPPTRPGLPDYGEFGRFERLVYAAYTWLVLAAFVELLSGAATLLGYSIPISTDAIRHMYLLGFITHLVFGASVRMLPGFIKRKRVASTVLVDATFWLGGTATVCRVIPLLSPSWFFDLLPAGDVLVQTIFAISGVFGWGAVLCLAMNLRQTAAAPVRQLSGNDWTMSIGHPRAGKRPEGGELL
ncbi:MAG: hypothetical protein K8G79_07340 [bacterium]|uniref:Uncharacterized protein n=1 Tax=Candidatus Methylomirabilis tolerans TaxID=3123416 RepID=A0AAJ1AKN5_9BACT|nr:hypothetical protein [Candidatus Methylomirabilis sp.]